MATVLVLFGIIGHLIGLTTNPTRDVRNTLYPAPSGKPIRPIRSAGLTAKFSTRPIRRED